eukprot:5411018-Amphidinium_carterae.1
MANLDELRAASGMVGADRVKTLAGQLAWASGMFTWLKSFNKRLWGALLEHEQCPSRPKASHLMFVVRIKTALDWVHAALNGQITYVVAGVERNIA